MREASNIIYDRRSKALHSGAPMPDPMMWPPSRDPDGGVYWDQFPGFAFGSAGVQWAADDIPMLLHAFEYIVREALKPWWSSIQAAHLGRVPEDDHRVP
jgi:hypothetical protein